MSEMTISEKYFEEYRQNKIKIKKLNDEIKATRAQIDQLTQQRDNLNSEVHSMQIIITDMIDNGWDPVEAKLKREDGKFYNNLWETRLNGFNSSSPAMNVASAVSLSNSNLVSSVTMAGDGHDNITAPKSTLSRILSSVF